MDTKKILKGSELKKRKSLAEKVKAGESSIADVFVDDTGGVINKKVLDAQSRARQIIEEANILAAKIRAEAEEILSQVKAEMEKSKAKGFNEGREEGLGEATSLLVRLEAIKEKFYNSAEADIIRLVMAIAEKVIGRIVHENTEAIKSIVKQALESALGEKIVIRLNPNDYKVVTANDFEFRDMLDRTKRITFKEDDSITRGGCVVETEVGTIDARLETQLKAIRKALEL